VKFIEYGSKQERLVVYFHGAPGALEECSVFDEYANKHNLHIVCFDRFSIDSTINGREYYLFIANAIKDKASGEKLDIIGFSIGCHVAIETGILLGDQVKNLHLVSSAAPLESGRYLDEMAGAIVFKLAMKFPMAFRLLSYWQSLIFRVSPKLLYSMIFSSARGKDKALSESPEFTEYITPILANAYCSNINGYLRDVTQYVNPWVDTLSLCSIETHLWHGTEDNWSPASMATFLAEAISTCSGSTLVNGASHYSCLFESAPEICRQLGNSQ
jgi:pimeloyl-ACP methyl ester carboxylesterase